MDELFSVGILVWIGAGVLAFLCVLWEYHRRRELAQAQKEEEKANKQEAFDQAERNVARRHLVKFYQEHADFLKGVPFDLLEAFIRAEMADSLTPTQAWSVCHKKIAELKEVMEKEQWQQQQEDKRQEGRQAQIRKIDQEIEKHRQNIANVEKRSGDSDLVEDTRRGELAAIQRLEEQKDILQHTKN